MINIKYGGTLENRDMLAKLEEEFADIAKISGWEYSLVTENFNTLTTAGRRGLAEPEFCEGLEQDDEIVSLNSADVYLEGMSIRLDPRMDPLKLTFDKKCRLSSISFCTTDTIGINRKFTVKKYEFLYYPYVRLHTPDASSHMQVVKLLDYLKKSYVRDLSVSDTSGFWESRDEEELKVRMWKEQGVMFNGKA